LARRRGRSRTGWGHFVAITQKAFGLGKIGIQSQGVGQQSLADRKVLFVEINPGQIEVYVIVIGIDLKGLFHEDYGLFKVPVFSELHPE
jgi:hypothetical protein